MARNEKDRLGNKLRDVERGREDQYFAERDRKLVEQMRRVKGTEAKTTETLRCPRCDGPLVTSRLHGVSVDECPVCHGVWLDKGGLDLIAERENDGWIARWLRREFNESD